jgi:beta-lactamase regulating signal transducer with metallopeptidase domain
MKRRHYLGLLVVGIGIALLITFFSPLASSEPDGLEKVAENHGFITQAEDAPYEIIADYVFPWVDNEDLATILAGMTGVLIVAAVALAFAFLLWRLRVAQRSTSSGGGPG